MVEQFQKMIMKEMKKNIRRNLKMNGIKQLLLLLC